MKASSFNKAGFKAYVQSAFHRFDDEHVADFMDNVLNYALEHHNVSLDQLCYFLSDMMPFVSFGEVAAFMDDDHLTAAGLVRKRETLENGWFPVQFTHIAE